MNSIQTTFRVSGQERDSYYVIDDKGTMLRAELKGSLRLSEELWPTVGDYIKGRWQPGEWVVIDEVINRNNILVRQGGNFKGQQAFAANVDFMFVVTSANDDFNENRLERYVTMALSCEIQPVIVINKMDLAESPQEYYAKINDRFSAVPSFGVSATSRQNLEMFDDYLTSNKTAVFVGSSGVGKSSLVNQLLTNEVQVTSEIRETDGKGRHTTTSRSLFQTKNKAWIIDTPGIRELGIVDGNEAVDILFDDLSGLASACKFRDCSHQTEPGCAVREALESGEIDLDRWESYTKLKRETLRQERKQDPRSRLEHKRKWKSINKSMRNFRKMRGE